jgi:hypothetical protein
VVNTPLKDTHRKEEHKDTQEDNPKATKEEGLLKEHKDTQEDNPKATKEEVQEDQEALEDQ